MEMENFSFLIFLFIFMIQLNVQLDGSNPKVDPNDEPDFYEQAMIPA